LADDPVQVLRLKRRQLGAHAPPPSPFGPVVPVIAHVAEEPLDRPGDMAMIPGKGAIRLPEPLPARLELLPDLAASPDRLAVCGGGGAAPLSPPPAELLAALAVPLGREQGGAPGAAAERHGRDAPADADGLGVINTAFDENQSHRGFRRFTTLWSEGAR